MMRVNWPAVLADLCCGPLNVYGLARQLEIPRSTLRGWIDGAEPGHAEGERLIAVWMRMKGKERDSLPMEEASLSAADMR